MGRGLNYDAVGATRPDARSWPPTPSAYRRYERSTRIGHGSVHWEYARAAILRWGVKTRSGFTVAPATDGGSDVMVLENAEYTLIAHFGPFRINEPVRVVAVLNEIDRSGFAYGTVRGHPVSGEEAFIVHRSEDGAVWLTLRSLTRPAPGVWRVVFPVLLIAQRYYRRRYAKALMQRNR